MASTKRSALLCAIVAENRQQRALAAAHLGAAGGNCLDEEVGAALRDRRRGHLATGARLHRDKAAGDRLRGRRRIGARPRDGGAGSFHGAGAFALHARDGHGLGDGACGRVRGGDNVDHPVAAADVERKLAACIAFVFLQRRDLIRNKHL